MTTEGFLDPVVPELFAASLDLHRAIQYLGDHPHRARESLRTAISRLDHSVTLVRRAAVAALPVNEPDLRQRAVDALLSLTAELVREWNLSGFLHALSRHSAELANSDTAAVILVAGSATPYVAAVFGHADAATDVGQQPDGPWIDLYRSGHPVAVADLGATHDRWPRFAATAQRAGFRSVAVWPLRAGHRVLGALVLLSTRVGEPPTAVSDIAQGLADLAAIAVQHLTARLRPERFADQFQDALHDQIIVEQAKGVAAERHNKLIDDAATAMRDYAHRYGMRLAEVAQAVLDREIDLSPMLS